MLGEFAEVIEFRDKPTNEAPRIITHFSSIAAVFASHLLLFCTRTLVSYPGLPLSTPILRSQCAKQLVSLRDLCSSFHSHFYFYLSVNWCYQWVENRVLNIEEHVREHIKG